MRVFLSGLVLVLVVLTKGSEVRGESLPVSPDQCRLNAQEADFEYVANYHLQKLRFCAFGRCKHAKKGSYYLALSEYLPKGLVYYSTFRPLREEESGKFTIEISFERYTSEYYDEDSKDKIYLDMKLVWNPWKQLWESDLTEKDESRNLLRSSRVSLPMVHEGIEFSYQMKNGAVFRLTCKLPYPDLFL